MNVTRYELQHYVDFGQSKIVESDSGELIDYSDYKKLEMRASKIEQALAWVLNDVEEWCDSVGKDSSWDSCNIYYKSFAYGGIEKARAIMAENEII